MASHEQQEGQPWRRLSRERRWDADWEQCCSEARRLGHRCRQPRPERGLRADLLPLCQQAQPSRTQRGRGALQQMLGCLCRWAGRTGARQEQGYKMREAAAGARGLSERSTAPQAWLATSIAHASRGDSGGWRTCRLVQLVLCTAGRPQRPQRLGTMSCPCRPGLPVSIV